MYAYTRETAGERWLVVLNFGHATATVDLAGLGDGTVRLSSDPARHVPAAAAGTVTVANDEGVLIALG